MRRNPLVPHVSSADRDVHDAPPPRTEGTSARRPARGDRPRGGRGVARDRSLARDGPVSHDPRRLRRSRGVAQTRRTETTMSYRRAPGCLERPWTTRTSGSRRAAWRRGRRPAGPGRSSRRARAARPRRTGRPAGTAGATGAAGAARRHRPARSAWAPWRARVVCDRRSDRPAQRRSAPVDARPARGLARPRCHVPGRACLATRLGSVVDHLHDRERRVDRGHADVRDQRCRGHRTAGRHPNDRRRRHASASDVHSSRNARGGGGRCRRDRHRALRCPCSASRSSSRWQPGSVRRQPRSARVTSLVQPRSCAYASSEATAPSGFPAAAVAAGEASER
jgi:hypothetical protein